MDAYTLVKVFEIKENLQTSLDIVRIKGEPTYKKTRSEITDDDLYHDLFVFVVANDYVLSVKQEEKWVVESNSSNHLSFKGSCTRPVKSVHDDHDNENCESVPSIKELPLMAQSIVDVWEEECKRIRLKLSNMTMPRDDHFELKIKKFEGHGVVRIWFHECDVANIYANEKQNHGISSKVPFIIVEDETVMKHNIRHALDGDARRQKLMLDDYLEKTGVRYNIPWSGWMLSACVHNNHVYGLYDQDFIHNGKKLVNAMDNASRELVLGDVWVTLNHVSLVYRMFPFDAPRVPESDLARDDRQNWAAAQKIASRKVQACLKSLYEDSGISRDAQLGQSSIEVTSFEPEIDALFYDASDTFEGDNVLQIVLCDYSGADNLVFQSFSTKMPLPDDAHMVMHSQVVSNEDAYGIEWELSLVRRPTLALCIVEPCKSSLNTCIKVSSWL
ncbi:hypothetical protein L7F22_020620 [Adiantum nelumboides]|nr:hypothetical protein [Adiantum nelumboides]